MGARGVSSESAPVRHGIFHSALLVSCQWVIQRSQLGSVTEDVLLVFWLPLDHLHTLSGFNSIEYRTFADKK